MGKSFVLCLLYSENQSHWAQENAKLKSASLSNHLMCPVCSIANWTCHICFAISSEDFTAVHSYGLFTRMNGSVPATQDTLIISNSSLVKSYIRIKTRLQSVVNLFMSAQNNLINVIGISHYQNRGSIWRCEDHRNELIAWVPFISAINSGVGTL